MSDLRVTSERIAMAHRAAAGTWTFGNLGTVESATNADLNMMVGDGLIQPYWLPDDDSEAATDDGPAGYWALTEAGQQWLTRAEQESAR